MTTLLCERTGAVATVTLNRPEALNALNATMFDELEALFLALRDDAEVRVVLITGAGERAFAAGADIRELAGTNQETGAAVSRRGQEVLLSLERCGKPVIACIKGLALGGGLELALACTLRLLSETAQLGMPETKLGLMPGFGGTQRLPRLIGDAAALQIMLTGQTLHAADALRLGLVQEVHPAAQLMVRAHELAETIAARAPLAIEATLRAVRESANLPLEEGCRAETSIFGQLCGSRDKEEGLAAFLEKRPPAWQGR